MQKYFNEGNDCDMCRHQFLTGRDGDVLDCRRSELGLSREFEERDIQRCPVCNNEVDREDMDYTLDCDGITFRLVCCQCWEKIMSKGYDEESYTEEDEYEYW